MRLLPPIHVVIPMKDRVALTAALVEQLVEQGAHRRVWVYDNGCGPTARRWLHRAARRGHLVVVEASGQRLHTMWNDGIDRARAEDPEADIAILNNDLVLGEAFLHRLQVGLHSAPDLWAVSPNYAGRDLSGVARVTSTFKHGGLAGFAVLARAEAFQSVRFDERFAWWYGDDDFVWQVEQAGRRVAIVGNATVEHVGGGSRTVLYDAATVATIEADLLYGLQKWFAGQPDSKRPTSNSSSA